MKRFLLRRMDQVRSATVVVQGSLHFYRYDNVQADDQVQISLWDNGLVFSQYTSISVNHLKVTINSKVSGPKEIIKELPKPVYPVFLIDWDKHIQEQQKQGHPVTVEEELITSVMENKKITVKELLLQPARQPLILEKGKQFIEGELKYL